MNPPSSTGRRGNGGVDPVLRRAQFDIAVLKKKIKDLEARNANTIAEYQEKLVAFACGEREASPKLLKEVRDARDVAIKAREDAQQTIETLQIVRNESLNTVTKLSLHLLQTLEQERKVRKEAEDSVQRLHSPRSP